MYVFDPALLRQQAQRKAFLAERNYWISHGLFIAANVGFWLFELMR